VEQQSYYEFIDSSLLDLLLVKRLIKDGHIFSKTTIFAIHTSSCRSLSNFNIEYNDNFRKRTPFLLAGAGGLETALHDYVVKEEVTD
jgi:hypothetical protein